MQSSVRQSTKRQTTAYRTYVRQEFRRDFEIPMLPYQHSGILSKTLWNNQDSVIRIIPGFDRATGQVFRQNINVNEYATDAPQTDYLSDTFMMATTAQNFGVSRQTFITDYAPGSEDEQQYGGDTVISVFARNVIHSVTAKRKPKFGVSMEMRRWAGQDRFVRFCSPSLFMQALVFRVNGRDNTDDNGNPLIDEDGDILPMLAVVAVEGRST